MKIRKSTIEITLFWLGIFLQNFALIRTSSFGIPLLIIVLGYISIKYNFFNQKSAKIYIFVFMLLLFIILGSTINKYYNVNQVLRLLMIVFAIWSSFKYIKIIYLKGLETRFWNIFLIILVVILIAGIYSYLAGIYKWPLFLNILNNNPSYGGNGVRGLYFYWGGWVDKGRIYVTFFEPSVYALFISIVFTFLLQTELIRNKRNKFILLTLCISNILFTFSRTGYGTIIYVICILIFNKIFKKFYLIRNLGNTLILLIPLFNLFVMILMNNIYSDLSTIKRTATPLYFFSQSFDNIKSLVIGHGIGSLAANAQEMNDIYIEQNAHNGYIELLYQFGIVFLCSYLIFIKSKINQIRSDKNRILFLSIISTFMVFESYYNVESIVCFITVVYGYCLMKDVNKSRKV